MKEGTEGLAPDASGVPVEGSGEGGVPEGTPAPGSGDAHVDRPGGQERPPEERLVPETHLRELQSAKDRELAERAKAWEAEKFQLVQALLSAQDEADKARYVGDEVGYQQARATRQQAMNQLFEAQRASQFESMARTIAIKQMSMTYGVKEEELSGFHHPEDMERFAKAMAGKRRADAFERRRETNQDSAEGSASSGANPIKDLMDVDELLRRGYAKK